MPFRHALTIGIGMAVLAISRLAAASTHTGTVAMLELWPNGNVAFTLNGVTLPCNGQVIVNGARTAQRTCTPRYWLPRWRVNRSKSTQGPADPPTATTRVCSTRRSLISMSSTDQPLLVAQTTGA